MSLELTASLSPEVQRWLAYAVMTGHSDEVIEQHLGGKGYDMAALRRYADELRQHPATQLCGEWVGKLAQLRWLTHLQSMVRNQNPSLDVPVIPASAIGSVRRDYLFASRPVKITGLLDEWPARQWSPETLKQRWGHRPVQFIAHLQENGTVQSRNQSGTFAEFLDLSQGPQDHGTYYWTAYNQSNGDPLVSEMTAELRSLPELCTPDLSGGVYFWVGPQGTRSGLHFDSYNVAFSQVVGSKRFWLLPPSDLPLLDVRNEFFSTVDLEHGDPQARPELRPSVVDVHAGEVLLIPVGWFHQVTSLSWSISASLTNIDIPGGNSYPLPSTFRGVI